MTVVVDCVMVGFYELVRRVLSNKFAVRIVVVAVLTVSLFLLGLPFVTSVSVKTGLHVFVVKCQDTTIDSKLYMHPYSKIYH